jgi:OOP family OmpA-OmpF porin
MNKLLCLTLAAIAAAALPSAQAAELSPYYAGVAFGTSGEMTYKKDGISATSDRPRPVKLYGGYQLSDSFAIEAGYTRFGGFKYKDLGGFDYSAMHLAVKGGMQLGDSFTVYGKVGMSRLAGQSNVLGASHSQHEFSPLIGVGVSYRINEKWSLTLDVTDYGRMKKPGMNVRSRSAELGLNYRF